MHPVLQGHVLNKPSGCRVWASEKSITAVWLLASLAWHRPEKLHFFLSVSSMQESQPVNCSIQPKQAWSTRFTSGGDSPGLLEDHFFYRPKPDSPHHVLPHINVSRALPRVNLMTTDRPQLNIGSDNMQATTAVTFSAKHRPDNCAGNKQEIHCIFRLQIQYSVFPQPHGLIITCSTSGLWMFICFIWMMCFSVLNHWILY